MKASRKAYMYALLAIFFWSTMSSAFKLSLQLMGFELLLFWSVTAALLLLIGILTLRGELNQFIAQTSKSWGMSALMGLINPFGYYLVLFKAYDLLRAQEAGVLNYTWPVILVLLSLPFLGQRIGVKGFVAILISFFGLIVISTEGNPFSMQLSNPIGVALAVGSAFLWAGYWIINMRDQRNAILKITTNMLFGFLYICLYIILFADWKLPSLKGFAAAVYIGFFEMGITFVWWLLALQHASDTARISNLVFISPFIALFWIQLFVGERILPSTIIGLFLIVGGIVLQQSSLGKKHLAFLYHSKRKFKQ